MKSGGHSKLVVTDEQMSRLSPISRVDRVDIFEQKETPLFKVRLPDDGREFYLKETSREALKAYQDAEPLCADNRIVRWARCLPVTRHSLPKHLSDAFGAGSDKVLVLIESVPFDGNGLESLTSGESLSTALEGVSITIREARQLLGELAAMRDKGVVHGDLAGNIDIRRVNGRLICHVIDPEPAFAKHDHNRDLKAMTAILQECQSVGVAERGELFPCIQTAQRSSFSHGRAL